MTNKPGPKPRPVEQRFWDKVDVRSPDECWPWIGATQHGYGYLMLRSPHTWIKAHRLSWQMHNGPIPEGAFILHHCDNPPCVNPAHLYLGTKADNARDRSGRKRGRENRQRGEGNLNAKLTDERVRQIIEALREVPRRSQREIAEEHGVSQQQVSRIMHRVSWGHLWE